MPRPIADGRPIRWGILGAGSIADTFSSDINLTAGNVVTAVAARDADRAAGFAARHAAARSYGDYGALVNDDEIDVVYIATTHPYHRAHALLAIEAGKSVLIEKPVCLNAGDAREVFAAAAQADVFAMEAMWTRTNPLIRTAQQLIADGAIGEVRGVRSEFGLGVAFDPADRLYDLDNGGGALLDLGIYPATFAYVFLGPPDEVRTVGTLAPTGADETVAMQWVYQGRPGSTALGIGADRRSQRCGRARHPRVDLVLAESPPAQRADHPQRGRRAPHRRPNRWTGSWLRTRDRRGRSLPSRRTPREPTDPACRHDCYPRSPRRRPRHARRHLPGRAVTCAEPVTVAAPSVARRAPGGAFVSRMSGGCQSLLPDVLEVVRARSGHVVQALRDTAAPARRPARRRGCCAAGAR